MDPKERFYKTIKRQPVDRATTWIGMSVPSAMPGLLKYFKSFSIEEIKIKLEEDIWPINVPYNNPPTNDIGCALSFANSGIGGAQDAIDPQWSNIVLSMKLPAASYGVS